MFLNSFLIETPIPASLILKSKMMSNKTFTYLQVYDTFYYNVKFIIRGMLK